MDKASLEQKTKYAEYIKYNIREYYKVLATGRMLRQDGTVEQIFIGTQRYKEILETISYLENERENVEKEIQEAGLKPYVFGQVKPEEPKVDVNLDDDVKARIYQELRIITKIKDNLIPSNYKDVKESLSEEEKDKYRKIGSVIAKAKFDLLDSVKDQINLTKEEREALEKGDLKFFEKFGIKDAKALMAANGIEKVNIKDLDEDVRLQYVSEILDSVHGKLEQIDEQDNKANTKVDEAKNKKELEQYDKDIDKQFKECKKELQTSLDYKKIESLQSLGVDASSFVDKLYFVSLTPTNEKVTGSFGKDDNALHIDRDIKNSQFEPNHKSCILAVKEVNELLDKHDDLDIDAVLAALEIKLQEDIELLERDDEDSYSRIEDAKFYTETFGRLKVDDKKLEKMTTKKRREYRKELSQAAKDLGITKSELLEKIDEAENITSRYALMKNELGVVSGLLAAQILVDNIKDPKDLVDNSELLKKTGFTKTVVRDRKDVKYKDCDTGKVIGKEPIMVPSSALKGLRGYSEVEEKISYDKNGKTIVEEVTNLEDKNGRKLCKLDIHINEEPIDIDKYVEKINSLNEEKEAKLAETKVQENDVQSSIDLENEIQGVVAEAADVDLSKVLGEEEPVIENPDTEITMDDYEDTMTWD